LPGETREKENRLNTVDTTMLASGRRTEFQETSGFETPLKTRTSIDAESLIELFVADQEKKYKEEKNAESDDDVLGILETPKGYQELELIVENLMHSDDSATMADAVKRRLMAERLWTKKREKASLKTQHKRLAAPGSEETQGQDQASFPRRKALSKNLL